MDRLGRSEIVEANAGLDVRARAADDPFRIAIHRVVDQTETHHASNTGLPRSAHDGPSGFLENAVTKAAVLMAAGPRILYALLGSFAAVTLAWSLCAVAFGGDAFPPTGLSPIASASVAMVAGAYAGSRARSLGTRVGLVVGAVAACVFWFAVPNGWWALPPPRRDEVQIR
jgi:hypothetical protein